MQVGLSSLVVAVLGVIAPFALGWLVGAWLLPDDGAYVHAFLGATLCATSVGITARVLKDLGQIAEPEARIILGAAVIDDVLGLVILAVVAGIIAAADSRRIAVVRRRSASSSARRWCSWSARSSLGVVPVAAPARASPRSCAASGVLLATRAVASASSSRGWRRHRPGAHRRRVRRRPVLEDVHYRDFADRGEHELEELVRPIASFLVPVFFVLMGMRTDLRVVRAAGRPRLALALTVAAIIGKQVCSLGVLGRGIDRLSVGIGMIPRGEVGLIFANIGLGLTLGGRAGDRAARPTRRSSSW